MNLRRIGGIILSFLGSLLTFIFVATIVKIIESRHRELSDLLFALIMISGAILGLVMLINGCRMLGADKFIKKMVLVMQKILGSRIIFVVISLLCICGLFIFKKKLLYQWICMMVGNICLLIYGALKGRDFKESGKWKRPMQLQGVIATPVMLYWLVVYLLMQYVIGW